MKTKPISSSMLDEAVAQASGKEVVTQLEFKDGNGVSFEVTPDGTMLVRVKGREIPEYYESTFAPEYIEFLRNQGVSDICFDLMYKAVEEGLRRGLALDAMMSAMK